MNRQWFTPLSRRLIPLLLLGLIACAPDEEGPEVVQPPPDRTPASTPQPTTPAPPAKASAGRPDRDTHVNPRAVLTGGASGAPQARSTPAWRPGFAAQHLVDSGLTYDNGFSHDVTYAQCTGDSSYYYSDGYTQFDCYIESSAVAPYWIRLTVADGGGSARFRFVQYAN